MAPLDRYIVLTLNDSISVAEGELDFTGETFDLEKASAEARRRALEHHIQYTVFKLTPVSVHTPNTLVNTEIL